MVSTVMRLLSGKLRPSRLSAVKDMQGIGFEPFDYIVVASEYWHIYQALFETAQIYNELSVTTTTLSKR